MWKALRIVLFAFMTAMMCCTCVMHASLPPIQPTVRDACPAVLPPVNKPVFIDDSFRPDELKAIQRAFDSWRHLSMGAVNYRMATERMKHVSLAANPSDTMDGTISLYRVTDDDPVIVTYPKSRIGLAASTWIVLIADRLPTEDSVQATMMHEVGHTLGMSHTPSQYAIMHETCDVTCTRPEFTVDDVVEYCKVSTHTEM